MLLLILEGWLVMAAFDNIGTEEGWLVLFFAAIIMPAPLAILAITHSPLQSLNPVAIARLLKESLATLWIASVYLFFAGWLSIQVETFGTNTVTEARIVALLKEHFDFRPVGIMRQFKLRHLPGSVKGGFYRKLAAYGHVGRMDIGLPWEVTDKLITLKEAVACSFK